MSPIRGDVKEKVLFLPLRAGDGCGWLASSPISFLERLWACRVLRTDRAVGCSYPTVSVEVKLFSKDGELYVLAKSEGHRAKELAIRRKKLARLLWKLHAMRLHPPSRVQLLLRIGAARKDAGRAAKFVILKISPKEFQSRARAPPFIWRKNNSKGPSSAMDIVCALQYGRRRSRCLVGALHPVDADRGGVSHHEERTRHRSIYHRLEHRVEAHILVAFLAYCLIATLKNRQALAPGLTPKAVLEKRGAWPANRSAHWTSFQMYGLFVCTVPSSDRSL
jgi:hypothetical protein